MLASNRGREQTRPRACDRTGESTRGWGRRVNRVPPRLSYWLYACVYSMVQPKPAPLFLISWWLLASACLLFCDFDATRGLRTRCQETQIPSCWLLVSVLTLRIATADR